MERTTVEFTLHTLKCKLKRWMEKAEYRCTQWQDIVLLNKQTKDFKEHGVIVPKRSSLSKDEQSKQNFAKKNMERGNHNSFDIVFYGGTKFGRWSRNTIWAEHVCICPSDFLYLLLLLDKTSTIATFPTCQSKLATQFWNYSRPLRRKSFGPVTILNHRKYWSRFSTLIVEPGFVWKCGELNFDHSKLSHVGSLANCQNLEYGAIWIMENFRHYPVGRHWWWILFPVGAWRNWTRFQPDSNPRRRGSLAWRFTGLTIEQPEGRGKS